MEIAKYIGLFLLKNQFCYVHGLGNLELKKLPATHDGATLNGPSYEVVITPGGSIDDNLANFIATNEQISISKAANALREYSIQARKDLSAGKEVQLSNLGKIVEQNGRLKFITDENFRYTPAGIPTIKNSKQLDEQNARPAHKPSYPPPTKADAVNWNMVILVVVLLLVLGGGGYGIYYYMQAGKATTATTPVDTVAKAQPVAPPPVVVDTAKKDTAAVAAPPVMDSMQVNMYRMVIGSYPTHERADKRVHNLSSIGNKVETVRQDSTSYLVVATVSCRAADTTHVKDSLQTLFGYKGVRLVK